MIKKNENFYSYHFESSIQARKKWDRKGPQEVHVIMRRNRMRTRNRIENVVDRNIE